VALKTLTLKKAPDPAKIALSLQIGHRFIDRKGRYILQVHVFKTPVLGVHYSQANSAERTWVDIPLVPETYGEAQS
jgi:hypothetical protein